MLPFPQSTNNKKKHNDIEYKNCRGKKCGSAIHEHFFPILSVNFVDLTAIMHSYQREMVKIKVANMPTTLKKHENKREKSKSDSDKKAFHS